MTEAEWLVCDDPERMLRLYSKPVMNERKLRLFACACCQIAGMGDRVARHRLDTDGPIGEGGVIGWAMRWARRENLERPDPTERAALLREIIGNPWKPIKIQRITTWRCPSGCTFGSSSRSEEKPPEFCKPSCGNRIEVTWPTPWLTPTVLTLAKAAYEERVKDTSHLDPARMAILADALEEAGSEEATLLDHLRKPGPHVRGCWALDCLLNLS